MRDVSGSWVMYMYIVSCCCREKKGKEKKGKKKEKKKEISQWKSFYTKERQEVKIRVGSCTHTTRLLHLMTKRAL